MNYRELLDANGFNGGCGMAINYVAGGNPSQERIDKLRSDYLIAVEKCNALGDNLTQKDLPKALGLARNAERKCAIYLSTVSARHTFNNPDYFRIHYANIKDDPSWNITWDLVQKGVCIA